MLRFRKRAQSTAEYAIVIALVVGAVVTMQVYVRRSLQARMAGAVANMVTSTPTLGTDIQFEPLETERQIGQSRTSTTQEDLSSAAGTEGQVTRTLVVPETTTVEPGAYETQQYTGPQ